MPIIVSCPCGKQTKVKDEYAGKKIPCPACQGVVAVPAGEALDTLPPPEIAAGVGTRSRARTVEDARHPAGNQRVRKRGLLWIVAAAAAVVIVVAGVAIGVIMVLNSGLAPQPVNENATIFQPRARFNIRPAGGGKDTFRIDRLLISADGSRVFASKLGPDRTIQAWDATGSPKRVNDLDGYLMALSADGRRLVRATNADQLEVVEVDGGKVLGRMPWPSGISGVYFLSPDVVLALPNSGNSFMVREYDAASGNILRSFTPSVEVANFRGVINGGKELVVGFKKTDQVKVWDLSTQKMIREFSFPAKPGAWSPYAVDPDGKWLGLGSGIYSAVDGAFLASLPPRTDCLRCAVFPGRDILLLLKVAGHGAVEQPGDWREIIAFDYKKQAVVAVFGGSDKRMRQIASSADGKVLAAGDEVGNVLLWDLAEVK